MYRPIKDHNNKTGNEKKTAQFYEELDEILGHQPASTPPVVLDACAGGLSALPEREDGYNVIVVNFVLQKRQQMNHHHLQGKVFLYSHVLI